MTEPTSRKKLNTSYFYTLFFIEYTNYWIPVYIRRRNSSVVLSDEYGTGQYSIHILNTVSTENSPIEDVYKLKELPFLIYCKCKTFLAFGYEPKCFPCLGVQYVAMLLHSIGFSRLNLFIWLKNSPKQRTS